jgi:hypothetical protein
LDEGDSETFDFDVFTSASINPGLYELTFTIKFDNSNVTTITETSNAGIIVGGQTDFDVSISDISSTGIILSVSNTGKNPATAVTVSIPEQSNFKISGSSSSIIGNLDKGDYSVASFQTSYFSGSSSNLNVKIQYTDTIGTRQILTKIVVIPVSSTTTSSASTTSPTATGYAMRSTSGSDNTILIIGFVISMILTIVIIVFLVKKNRKKNNEND